MNPKKYGINFKQHPFVWLLVPFTTGILTGHFTSLAFPLWPSVVFLLSCLMLMLPYRKYKFNKQHWWGLLTLMLLLAAGNTHYRVVRESLNREVPTGNKITFRAIVSDIPESRHYGYRVKAKIHPERTDLEPFNSMLYVESDTVTNLLKPGGVIIGNGQFQQLKNRGNPNEFNYKQYLNWQHIYYTSYINSGNWQYIPANHYPLRRFAFDARQHFKENINQKAFTDRQKAVLMALCLGDKAEMSETTMQTFRQSGIAHLFAVSGMHVGFIYLLFHYLGLIFFGFNAGMRKYIPVILSIVGIWVFCLITGLPSSAIRACIMFTVIAIGKWSGQRNAGLNNLALAAFIILLIKPSELFMIGFQLSFLAVAGILLMYPKIYRSIYIRNLFLRKIWSIVCLSLSAQFFIFPVIIYYFNAFSFAFIITNIFATPVAAILLYASLALNAIFLLPAIQHVLALLMKMLFTLFMTVLDMVNNVSMLYNNSLYITMLELTALLILMFVVASLIYRQHPHKILFSLSLILIFSLSVTMRNVQNHQRSEFTVYNIARSSALSLIKEKNQYLLADTTLLNDPSAEKFHIDPHKRASGIKKTIAINISNPPAISGQQIVTENIDGNLWCYFNEKKILVLNNPIKLQDPYKVDYLIVRYTPHHSTTNMLRSLQANLVIIDNQLYPTAARKWIRACDTLGLPYHYPLVNGAYIN